MTRTIVRLKVALLRSGLRRGGAAGIIGFVLAVLVALFLGLGGGIVAFALRFGDSVYRDDGVEVVGPVLLLGWVLGPVMAAAADGTLEVDRLAPFPLTRRQLMPGLLLASIVGVGGFGSVLLLLGLVAGVAPPTVGLLVVAAGAVILLLTCAATSRLVTTLISGSSRRRRWRDIVVFVAPMIAVSINIGVQVTTRALGGGRHVPHWVVVAAKARHYLPSGPVTEAMASAVRGDLAIAAAWLVGALVVLVVVVLLWGVVTDRVLTSAGASVGPATKERARAGDLPLLGGVLRLLPRTRLGVVAAKELRLQWRDPRQRAAFVAPVFAIAAPAIGAGALSGAGGGRGAMLAAGPAVLLCSTATNVYGFDGSSHWVNVAAGDDALADLGGKALARAIVAAVICTLLAIPLSIVAGSPIGVPAALGLATVAGGMAFAIGLPFSVRYPVALPDSATNVFSTGNTGAGAAQIGPGLATMFGSLLAAAPFAVATYLFFDTPLMVAVIAAEVGVGGGAALWGLRRAARRSQWQQPELLLKLGRRAGGG